MIILLSPAKSLDFDTTPVSPTCTQPDFQDESQKLINKLKKTSRKKLRELMDISKDLAELNWQRYQDWSLPITEDKGKQAVLAFKGDVYLGLKAWEMNEDELLWAQDHLRILSGLHGILRPLDLILPYRLEMGTSLPVGRRKNLYAFWADKIAPRLKTDLENEGSNVIINLASDEYFKAIDLKMLKARIIKINFKEWRKGKLMFVSFSAKKARGLMSAFAIKNKITDPEGLKSFDWEDYKFSPDNSSEDEWIFTREIN